MKHNFLLTMLLASLFVAGLQAADACGIEWDDEVTLDTAHTKYVVLKGGSAVQDDNAASFRIGNPEGVTRPCIQFGDRIYLKMGGNFLGSEDQRGGFAATGGREKRKDWEVWIVEGGPSGSPVSKSATVFLKSAKFGKYLSAQDDGVSMQANRDKVLEWEKFTIKKVK